MAIITRGFPWAPAVPPIAGALSEGINERSRHFAGFLHLRPRSPTPPVGNLCADEQVFTGPAIRAKPPGCQPGWQPCQIASHHVGRPVAADAVLPDHKQRGRTLNELQIPAPFASPGRSPVGAVAPPTAPVQEDPNPLARRVLISMYGRSMVRGSARHFQWLGSRRPGPPNTQRK